MRGEYIGPDIGTRGPLELPPRARRILTFIGGVTIVIGTTSACAENTVQNQINKPHTRNYLRVRGEYRVKRPVNSVGLELPPRARRIRFKPNSPWALTGTTSACAENTPLHNISPVLHGNYLRVRGEYMAAGMNPFPRKELPPRARRIPAPPRPARGSCRNYLRVRGEYPK